MAAYGDDGPETLARLVAEQAGTGRRYTFTALSERSVDPETSYRPSANLLWKISQGEAVKIHPALIRAIAEGLSLGLERVAEAATRQFIGYVVGDPLQGERAGAAVQVAHEPGAHAPDLPLAQEFVDGLLKDQQDES